MISIQLLHIFILFYFFIFIESTKICEPKILSRLMTWTMSNSNIQACQKITEVKYKFRIIPPQTFIDIAKQKLMAQHYDCVKYREALQKLVQSDSSYKCKLKLGSFEWDLNAPIDQTVLDIEAETIRLKRK